MIPAFEQVKTFHALNRTATVIGYSSDTGGKIIAMKQNISYIWPSGKPTIQLGGSTVQYSH
jgi:hypothetical protein